MRVGCVCVVRVTDREAIAVILPRKKRRVQTRGTKNKGLRHFSLKVCEKVQSKRVTTYNEVRHLLPFSQVNLRRGFANFHCDDAGGR